MDEHYILKNLIDLLEANRIRVRKEPLLDSPGGLCRVGRERVLFLDSSAQSLPQAEICASALAEVVDIENIYLRPDVREFVKDKTGS